MKEYVVNIDITECVNIEANSPEEAEQKVYDLLSREERIWGIRDAILTAEVEE